MFTVFYYPRASMFTEPSVCYYPRASMFTEPLCLLNPLYVITQEPLCSLNPLYVPTHEPLCSRSPLYFTTHEPLCSGAISASILQPKSLLSFFPHPVPSSSSLYILSSISSLSLVVSISPNKHNTTTICSLTALTEHLQAPPPITLST